jgi:hypothetical protein
MDAYRLALVGCMLWGGRFLVPLAIVSALWNYYLQRQNTMPTVDVYFHINLTIVLGSCLQAYIGSVLIRRFVGNPLQMSAFIQLWRFALCAGFASCLISPLISLGGIALLTGEWHAAQFASDFREWWLGDSFGAIAVTPLLLSLLCRSNISLKEQKVHRLVIPGGLLAIITLMLFIGYSANQEQKRMADFHLQQDVNLFEQTFNEQIGINIAALNTLEAIIVANRQVTAGEFRTVANLIFDDIPAMKVVAWSPLVQADGLDDYVKHIRTLPEMAGFTVKGPPSSNNAPYFFPLYIEPMSKNKQAQGQNFYPRPNWKQALQRVSNDHENIAIDLPDGFKKRNNVHVAILQPVLADHQDHPNKQLIGYTFCAFNADTLIQLALQKSGLAKYVMLRVYYKDDIEIFSSNLEARQGNAAWRIWPNDH